MVAPEAVPADAAVSRQACQNIEARPRPSAQSRQSGPRRLDVVLGADQQQIPQARPARDPLDVKQCWRSKLWIGSTMESRLWYAAFGVFVCRVFGFFWHQVPSLVSAERYRAAPEEVRDMGWQHPLRHSHSLWVQYHGGSAGRKGPVDMVRDLHGAPTWAGWRGARQRVTPGARPWPTFEAWAFVLPHVQSANVHRCHILRPGFRSLCTERTLCTPEAIPSQPEPWVLISNALARKQCRCGHGGRPPSTVARLVHK